MKFVKNRKEFFQYFPKNGIGVEIGVDAGGNAKNNLVPICKPSMLYLVDLWNLLENTPRNLEINHAKNQQQLSKFKLDKLNKLKVSLRHHSNISFMVMSSNDASKQFQNNSLDWVYIDACHEYHDVLDDLRRWYPKLKSGGILSGDDYNEIDAVLKGCKQAIDDFCLENNLTIFMKSKEKTVDWAVIKP